MEPEALNRVLDFGFDDFKLHRIQAGCAVNNFGSNKYLKGRMFRRTRKATTTLETERFEYTFGNG
jgi:RimJ/RimL family protein N-acetyltransferase